MPKNCLIVCHTFTSNLFYPILIIIPPKKTFTSEKNYLFRFISRSHSSEKFLIFQHFWDQKTNTDSKLSLSFPNTERRYFKNHPKAWLKRWSFQFVVSSVCMHLHTQHSDMSSRLLCLHVGICVCVSMCLCVSIYPPHHPNSWARRNFEKITKRLN